MKINSITWDQTQLHCRATDVSAKFKPNAYYRDSDHKMTVCAGYLYHSNSEFALAHALIHEISHSIDPCGISKAPARSDSTAIKEFQRVFNKNPFDQVIQCLRSPQSIEAKASPDSAKIKDPEVKCRFDQIGESFSDWLAAEIVPEYIEKNYQLTSEQYQNGYANIFRSLCTDEAKMNPFIQKVLSFFFPPTYDPHPSIDNRVNKIMAVHPKIRKDMKCGPMTSGLQHCPKNVDRKSSAPTTENSTGVVK